MIRFGASAVDVPTRSVVFDDEPRHLEPQAFDLLAYLLAHRDRVVPKTELLDAVWGDQFVSESALTTRVKEVRRAVGDDGTRQEIIKNFRGRGYRFVAVVDGDVDPARTQDRPFVTSLVGRDDDIVALDRLLGESRLVTLVGPGGVGKTSLAREVLALRRDLYPDGAPVIRLASVRDPEAIRHVLRREMGLEDTGLTDADLVAAIADLDALVVLDNCEHLSEEVARLVDAIMCEGGRVRLLATSRERLGLGVERVLPVEPLSAEMARRLLEERARSAQPGYELPPRSEASVLELLDRLDRLPLAIEMGAARLPSLGLDDLLTFLGDRLDLLRSVDRGADERHRTLSELIGWSEDLLDDDERDVLTCLATFAGPAIASDIAAVANVNSAELAIGSLAACVDHSLVIADTTRQPTAYRLLETVRAHAVLRRTPAHEARHANRIIDVAAEMDQLLRTPDEAMAAARLDLLEADLRVAHQWAREHDPARAGELTAALIHYAHERQWIEPASWAERQLETIPAHEPGAFAAAAACAASRSNSGDFSEAVTLAQPTLAADDPRIVSSALDTLINIGIYTGDLAMTRHYTGVLRALGEQTGDATIRANVLTSEMMVLTYGGKPSEAFEHGAQSKLPATASPTARAWVAYIEGDTLAALGRNHEAIDRYDEAIRLGSSVGSRFVASVARLSALVARSKVGDVAEAGAEFVPVLAEYWRARSVTHAITALRNLVELLVRAGDDETAMVLLGAMSNPDVKATYGAESQHLDEARATVESRVGPHIVEAWIDHGADHDVLWAVDHAIGVLS